MDFPVLLVEFLNVTLGEKLRCCMGPGYHPKRPVVCELRQQRSGDYRHWRIARRLVDLKVQHVATAESSARMPAKLPESKG